jgi:hypothetical protein
MTTIHTNLALDKSWMKQRLQPLKALYVRLLVILPRLTVRQYLLNIVVGADVQGMLA